MKRRGSLRLLTRIYPESLRKEHGEDLLEFLESQRKEPRYRNPVLGSLRFSIDVVSDALRASRAPARLRPRRGHRPGETMSETLRDLRHATRRLAASPVFAVASVVTLALGIGANTAIFSVVHAVVVSPLPYPDSDRLLSIYHAAPGADIPKLGLSYGTYLHYREHNRTFESMAAYEIRNFNLTGDAEPQRVDGASVTASFFDLFQKPALGRGIAAEEDRPGGDPVAVISDRLWQRRYGAEASILERNIYLDGEAFRVVGVMPPRFDFPSTETDLWIASRLDPERVTIGGFNPLGVGRLKPGVSQAEAQADLESLVPTLEGRFPGRAFAMLVDHAKLTPRVTPRKEEIVGAIEPTLWILLGAVGLLLLVACANVANLALVRAEGRRREVAVRSALGAGRSRIVRYFLVESVLLAVAGGVLGLLAASLGVSLLVGFGPESLPRLHEIAVNETVLGFTALVTFAAGLGFGIVPVLRFRAARLTTFLKDGARGVIRGQERRRGLLVISQIALAIVLLVGAGLMARSFWHLKTLDPGFDPEGVLTFRVSLPPSDYPDRETAARFQQQVLDRLSALPGVRDVGAVTCLPLTGCRQLAHIRREGLPRAPDEIPPPAHTRGVTEGYFAAMGIPLVAGRLIERADHEQQTGAVVVSRTFAERTWPGEDVIGKRVDPGAGEPPDWYRIVGVVGDVPINQLTDAPDEILYLPLLGRDDNAHAPESLAFVVKTTADPASLAAPVRRAVQALDGNLPLASVRPLAGLVSDAEAPMAFAMVLLGIAAAVALGLGALGVYGVLSYMVTQRTGEIGVRVALGASAGDVRRLVLGRGAAVSLLGLTLGLAGALALSRTMSSVLFEVRPTDPLTYASVSILLLAVALTASYVPARRAARQDPTEALRSE